MSKKRRKIHREMERAKNEALETAKNIVDKTLPLISEGVVKILSGFTKSVEESLKKELVGGLERKKNKSKGKKGVEPNDPQ